MQLVLSNNRIIAHGENFLAMGSVVINTETGARYENATIAECNGCPSDIDKVGYEYHAGVFVPCAPYGLGNNNGFFMEVCESCATPRSSGIPIKGGLTLDNFNEAFAKKLPKLTLLWENASPASAMANQTITLASADYDFLFIECQTIVSSQYYRASVIVQRPSKANYEEKASIVMVHSNGQSAKLVGRYFYCDNSYSKLNIGEGYSTDLYKTNSHSHSFSTSNLACCPIKIYGVKL